MYIHFYIHICLYLHVCFDSSVFLRFGCTSLELADQPWAHADAAMGMMSHSDGEEFTPSCSNNCGLRMPIRGYREQALVGLPTNLRGITTL